MRLDMHLTAALKACLVWLLFKRPLGRIWLNKKQVWGVCVCGYRKVRVCLGKCDIYRFLVRLVVIIILGCLLLWLSAPRVLLIGRNADLAPRVLLIGRNADLGAFGSCRNCLRVRLAVAAAARGNALRVRLVEQKTYKGVFGEQKTYKGAFGLAVSH
nr:hypothetical protein [Tanacetum cinerariifolium]